MPTVVLSIGQCGYDDSRITRLLRDECGALVERAHTATDAQRLMSENHYGLVLVNRVFDFDGESGVDFIRNMKSGGNPTPMMLISDYADAQQAAVEAGAMPGFGKSQIFTPGVVEMLRGALGQKVGE